MKAMESSGSWGSERVFPSQKRRKSGSFRGPGHQENGAAAVKCACFFTGMAMQDGVGKTGDPRERGHSRSTAVGVRTERAARYTLPRKDENAVCGDCCLPSS